MSKGFIRVVLFYGFALFLVIALMFFTDLVNNAGFNPPGFFFSIFQIVQIFLENIWIGEGRAIAFLF